jgi:hypothetical protein
VDRVGIEPLSFSASELCSPPHSTALLNGHDGNRTHHNHIASMIRLPLVTCMPEYSNLVPPEYRRRGCTMESRGIGPLLMHCQRIVFPLDEDPKLRSNLVYLSLFCLITKYERTTELPR